jgi:Domain of unknown function (DUF4200)
VQQALDSQKKEFEQHELDMKRREEALNKKDRELQDALLKFNRFLLVCIISIFTSVIKIS